MSASSCSCCACRAQRARDQILWAVPVKATQQFVRLQRVIAKRDQSLVCERARTVIRTTSDSDALERALHPHLLAQLEDDALSRALADPGDRLKARRVGARDRGQQLAWGAAGEHRDRDLRTNGLHREQHQEKISLLL